MVGECRVRVFPLKLSIYIHNSLLQKQGNDIDIYRKLEFCVANSSSSTIIFYSQVKDASYHMMIHSPTIYRKK